MNIDEGRFEEILEEVDRELRIKVSGELVPKHWPIFEIGEEVEVKGGMFRVYKIKPYQLILKPIGNKLKK